MSNQNITTNENERFWSIQIITFVNNFLANKNMEIKTAGGELTINTGKKVRFPDVVLYRDKLQTSIIQGWEIKMPDVPINDTEFIADAQRKARFLGSNSCLLWNFTYCVLYVQNEEGTFIKTKEWKPDVDIKTRTDVRLYRKNWETLLSEILLELNQFLINNELSHIGLENTISNCIIPNIIETNKSVVAEHIIDVAKKNALIRSYIEVWWNDVKIEYLSEEPDMFIAYSKVVLIHWINRILFANVIRFYHKPANMIENLTSEITPKQGDDIFQQISEKCDFYNIFFPVEYSELLPNSTWIELTEFNAFLFKNQTTDIEQKTLQLVLERSILTSKRQIAGQYSTPPKLAELLTKITVLDSTGISVDPCCGTGTIPKEIIKYKTEQGLSTSEAYHTTWAMDKFSFPLQITNISLTNSESTNIPSLIIQNNVFELKPGNEQYIVNPEDGTKMLVSIPIFDNIVSNLPFIDFNTANRENSEYLENVRNRVYNDTNIMLSERNDIYAYMLLGFYEKLSSNGRIGVITSNSWLATLAGMEFFEAMAHYFDIDGIYISSVENWFDNADVSTIILVLQKKDEISKPNYNFYTGLINTTINKWNDEVFDTLKNSILLKREINNKIITLRYIDNNTFEFAKKSGLSLKTLFYNVNWLYGIKDKLVKLTDYFKPFRGERTGMDSFFYLKGSGSVDNEYIVNCFKNPKKIKTITPEPTEKVFFCNDTKQQLESKNKKLTLSWIDKYSNQVSASRKKFKEKWHILNQNAKLVNFFIPTKPYKRFYCAKTKEPVIINQSFLGLQAKNKSVDTELMHALLNSIITYFDIEAIGLGMALGVLDLRGTSLNNSFILNPKLLNQEQVEEIKKAFQPICNRDIKNTVEEFELPDRIYFDKTVLKCFGIEKYYNEIKNTIISMQKARIPDYKNK